ncbi:MAG: GGDEF domain-containing protein [bacterium]
MRLLIVLFLVGYLTYVIVFWQHPGAWLNLLVPVIFFLGADFVWLAVTLSLQTATDIRRISQLEQENITDPLIGIYNRRYLDRRIEEEYARAERYALPLSVLLVDVDHFKHVNDTYGHRAGDQVLIALGQLLLGTVRGTDMVARYGGEEIVIVAPNTTLASAGQLAERMRQHVEMQEWGVTTAPHCQQQIRITVSIGVASLSLGTDDYRGIIHNADAALYRAKKEGRNRVVMHTANEPSANFSGT